MNITLVGSNSYEFFKMIVAVIFLFDALFFLPWFNRMFGTDYQKLNFVKNDSHAKFLWLLWVAGSMCMIFDFLPVIGSFILAIIFRYYYIHSRPNNLFRGGGAVGIFPALFAMYIFVVEILVIMDFDWATSQMVLYIMLFHTGLTIFDAGIYKVFNGYLKNDGFQYALMNPFWSYWCNTNIVNSVSSKIWRIINPFIAISQLTIGFLMLLPTTQAFGTVHLGLGFLVLAFFLKLANLPLLIGSLIFLFVDQKFETSVEQLDLFSWLQGIDLGLLLIGATYSSILLAGQIIVWLNFYFSIYLPSSFQRIFDLINLHLPILIWRVFSADVVNIYSLVYEVDTSGDKRLINSWNFMTDYGKSTFDRARFFNVAESCVMSSIFNSIRYNDKNLPLAKQRLLQYSYTLDPQLESRENDILFEVYRLTRNLQTEKIERIKIADWKVNLLSSTCERVWASSSSNDLISSFLRPFDGFGKYHA